MSREVPPERRAAAFFDIDGTLVSEPSLERRIFRALRRDSAISPLNYVRWGVEAVRLLPRGLAAISQGNKRYLHGLSVEQLLKAMDTVAFFEEGVARVEWHVGHGHQIVLASGHGPGSPGQRDEVGGATWDLHRAGCRRRELRRSQAAGDAGCRTSDAVQSAGIACLR